jgi:hypothetical protein
MEVMFEVNPAGNNALAKTKQRRRLTLMSTSKEATTNGKAFLLMGSSKGRDLSSVASERGIDTSDDCHDDFIHLAPATRPRG